MDMLHSFDPNVQCLKCGRCFVHVVTLREHEQFSCQPRLTFVCPPCDQQFENGWYLDQHLIRHQRQEFMNKQEASTSQPHQCGHCNTSFFSPFTLSTHQLYSCPEAPQSLLSQTSSDTDVDEFHEEQPEASDDEEEKLKIVENFPEDKDFSFYEKTPNVITSNEDQCVAVSNKNSIINNTINMDDNDKRSDDTRNNDKSDDNSNNDNSNDNSKNRNNDNDKRSKDSNSDRDSNGRSSSMNSITDNNNHTSNASNNRKNTTSDDGLKSIKALNVTLVLNSANYYLRKNKICTAPANSETRKPLKVTLKTKNAPEKPCQEVPESRQDDATALDAMLKDVPIDIDRKKLMETILKMVSTLKEGHKSLKAGDVAFLYDPRSPSEIRIVKVLKVTDGAFRAAAFEVQVENKKLAFSSNTEFLQLNSVFCHGDLQCPRKRDKRGITREFLFAFKALPRVFLGIFTSPRMVRSFDEENEIPEWMLCAKGEYKELGNSPENADEKPSSETTAVSDVSFGARTHDVTNNDDTDNRQDTKVDNLKAFESRTNNEKTSVLIRTDEKTSTSDRNIDSKLKSNPPEKTNSAGNDGRKKGKKPTDKIASVEATKSSKVSEKCDSYLVSEEKQPILKSTDNNCPKVENDKDDALSRNLAKLNSDIKKGTRGSLGGSRLRRQANAYPCRVCGRYFASGETRDGHEDAICNVSVKKDMWSCITCCHELDSSHEYDLHTVMKCSPKKSQNKSGKQTQGLKPFACKYCNKQFVQTRTLATHLDYCCDVKSEAHGRLSDRATRSARAPKACSCCR